MHLLSIPISNAEQSLESVRENNGLATNDVVLTT
jgi:hypothetical protein